MGQTAREASLVRRKALSATGKAALTGVGSDRTSATTGSTAVSTASATTNAQGGSARQAALARRIAMSKGGKIGIASADRVRGGANNTTTQTAAPVKADRQEGCGCGCGGKNKAVCGGANKAGMTAADTSATMSAPVFSTPMAANLVKRVAQNPTRNAALSRRKAMSAKGKTALKGGTVSEASAARMANPNLSSRELAQTLRQQRSSNGKTDKKQAGTVATGPGKHRRLQAAAADAMWKVGASDTAAGQTVTGTMVDRTMVVTGNEGSTCRVITGTEYMGADVFKDFCQADVKPAFNRVSVTSTGSGNRVSGNELGRAAMVTGNEPGTCKKVTGTEYVSAGQLSTFCGTAAGPAPSKFSITDTLKGKKVSGNNVGLASKVTGNESGADLGLTGTQYMQRGKDTAPAKVSVSTTLRGGSVTGGHVGRSTKVTGDEPGTCRNVTGDDYVGSEQYADFCQQTPKPQDKKVGLSNTLMGKAVTGTMTDRGGNVTGNEAGTCKAVTGTPYAGAVQTEAFCASPDKAMAMARARKGTTNVGPSMTGLQPGINGVMTGAGKGACEPVTGTPYVGADQAASVCPATVATPASPDFPQPIGQTPWGQFSVSPPSGGAQQGAQMSGVTGSRYEQGQITGPFGMAGGKVTGTEEARFGHKQDPAPMPVAEPVAMVDGRVKSRITGEGMDAGQKITGDDWDRGDRVTGTEGASAKRRNPTLRGPMTMASMAVTSKRNEDVVAPVSKVTGSSGNTVKGSLITYSGGARG